MRCSQGKRVGGGEGEAAVGLGVDVIVGTGEEGEDFGAEL